MDEVRTKETVTEEIHKLVQELVHLDDPEDESYLLTGWFIAGTGVSSTDVHKFRAAYFTSLELNPILAAGIADYAYSRTRESISKRFHDGRSE